MERSLTNPVILVPEVGDPAYHPEIARDIMGGQRDVIGDWLANCPEEKTLFIKQKASSGGILRRKSITVKIIIKRS